MTTLTDFLLARIDEDEEVARAAVGEAVFQRQTGRWSFEEAGARDHIVFAVADGGGRTQAADLTAAWEREERGQHIARHDPARVLAECEAKRRIIEFAWDNEELIDGEWGSCRGRDTLEADGELPKALRILAQVYADHPDFDPTWKA